jgi:ABC-type nickel/cobalt efflux system permease component RcnA
MRRRIALLVTAGLAGTVATLLLATPASAHPLGNFSINEYIGLTVHPNQVAAQAVVDIAEIPTLQNRPAVDANGDGTVSPAEASAWAGRTCADMAAAVHTAVGQQTLQWTVTSAGLSYAPGAAGLDTSRLSCALTASATVDSRTSLSVDNTYLADRVGWREMTAVGDEVALVDSPLPVTSVSNELRSYPKDLLASPLNLRSAVITVQPGHGSTGAAVLPALSQGDPFSRAVAAGDRRFADLADGGHLTIWVGLLAVLLAIVLGAGHAALPGHGKTVLAAYLAGKRGRPRDALVVAGTVTLTHTGGVLALGLLLTAGTAIAGEQILGWLGVVSGVVVLGVGISMVVGLLRRRRAHIHNGHTHDHHHDHHHDHGHGHGHDHDHGPARRGLGLAGIGIAGGLVPSPSALVVLLGAIGLGRTGFGVVLVLAYGAGLAAALTGAGLLMVVLQRRLERTTRRGRFGARAATLAGRLSRATPAVTAGLVVIVGAGLALRAATGVL